jgi:hypothetical protein
VRLLFDEHYAPEIGRKLRASGHDVDCVAERPDLRGRSDEQLFALMPAERRAIVTEDWADFGVLAGRAAAEGTDHYGIVFTSQASLPRGKNTIGLYVRVFDEFLRRYPADDAIRQSTCWVP